MASVKLFSLFASVHTVRNEAVVTSTSLLSPRRSHRGPMSPKPIIPCAYILGLHRVKIVTYFRVFKLWFTLSASASAVAPESPTLFHPRLWKRVFQNVCM